MENMNMCKGKVKQVSPKMAVTMAANQYQTLIDKLWGGGDEGAADTAFPAPGQRPAQGRLLYQETIPDSTRKDG